MKKLIAMLMLTAATGFAAWSAPVDGNSTNTADNTPILDARLECLFDSGRLGEVVQIPEKSSVDLLMERLIFERALVERYMCEQPKTEIDVHPE